MIRRIAKLPGRVALKLVRTVTGSGRSSHPPPRQADSWELRDQDLPAGEAHPHSHSHDHDHAHEHDHEAVADPTDAPVPATEPVVEEPENTNEPDSGVRPLTQVYPSETPNPNAWKFTLDRKVLDGSSISFNAKSEAQDHGLGRALFALAGVQSIFAVNDFITVTQDGSRSWDELADQIIQAIQSHA